MEMKLSRKRSGLPIAEVDLSTTAARLSCLRSSQNSWVGFRNKRFRRLIERWRFGVQEMSRKDLTTKHQLVHLVKRKESLSWILNKYGTSGDNTEASNENRRSSDLFSEEQCPKISSSARDHSHYQMSTTDDPSVEKNQWETVSTSHHVSSQKRYNFTRLNTVAFFVSLLLPMAALCIGCILGSLHGRFSKNSTPNKLWAHRRVSKRTRWKSILSEPTEGSDSSPDDNRVSSGDDEAPEEAYKAYSRVERDYQRFLSECGMSEHGYWRGGSS